MPQNERPLSVSVLTRKIQNELADFGPMSVQGELSQVKISANGHMYATLKDSDASLSLVMWRNVVVRQSQLPKEGDEVVVRGSLSVYAPRGQYQMTITTCRAVGQGDLAAQFEALKQRLTLEGLFDEDLKQPLPFLPRAVGLVTASGSAALADMLHGLFERFPRMHVVHVPAQVQGAPAKHEIVAALRVLDRHPEVDVIICGRGGGSLEDLWSFNEEIVVRALAACETPVVSAVGHETDVTLADLVADVRAKTPTAAAEMVVPELAELYETLGDYAETLYDNLAERLEEKRQYWQALAQHRALAGPAYQVNMRRQRADELQERLMMAMQHIMQGQRQQLQHQHSALKRSSPRQIYQRYLQQVQQLNKQLPQRMQQKFKDTQQRFAHVLERLEDLSPLSILKRGYAVVHDQDGSVVHAAATLKEGDAIQARVADGIIDAQVTATRTGGDISKKRRTTKKN